MKFKYSVIGDNTQENREWLEKLGYEPRRTQFDILVTYKMEDTGLYYFESFFNMPSVIETIKNKLDNTIDCRGNSPLFKAVSAMREDSDYMQWFTDGANDELCEGVDFMGEDAQFEYPELWENYRKCTLTKLQERFKEKER